MISSTSYLSITYIISIFEDDYTEISCVFRDEFVTAANSGNFNKSLSTEVREEIENIEQSLEQCRLSIQYRLMYEMMLGKKIGILNFYIFI